MQVKVDKKSLKPCSAKTSANRALQGLTEPYEALLRSKKQVK